MVIPGITAAVDSLWSWSDDIPVPYTPWPVVTFVLVPAAGDPVTDSLASVKELLVT